MHTTKLAKHLLAGLVAALVYMFGGSVGLAQDSGEEPIPVPPPEEPPPPAQQPPPPPPPQPVAPPTGQQTVIYTMPPVAAPPAEDPLVELRRKPKKLRYQEGQEPPPGYVEVEKARRGMVIAGAAVFGGVYIGCLISTPADPYLAVPIAGPMIAAYRYKADISGSRPYTEDERQTKEDRETSYRILGTFGTVAQIAGVTLFAVGLAVKKKIWLRQDIAGLSIQFVPTLAAENGPGFGLFGTF